MWLRYRPLGFWAEKLAKNPAFAVRSCSAPDELSGAIRSAVRFLGMRGYWAFLLRKSSDLGTNFAVLAGLGALWATWIGT